ncbi:hypothetical protein B0I35DRAFT_453128 [Stachybotrys elegans]|uniref:Fungal N-terminal domain-containing protein n=1 Tax=Stachybotrys elegans TaxID=80388 RepID=A0A8K0WN73_9HYPO|nr:hypothetical protein B0I35DRAFT_453128 [Stachybotrys elegans]
MADPLAIVGSLAAGLQLVTVAGQGLLVTIKLMRDLRDTPDKLKALLNDVEGSISRLCYNCNAGSVIYQNLDAPQMNRLSQCAASLYPVLEEIHAMLEAFAGEERGRTSAVRQLWKSMVSLKLEGELTSKLERLHRLNVELVRELGMIGLGTQMLTNGLISAGSERLQHGFTNIEEKIDSLQTDFQKFTLSVQRAQYITSFSDVVEMEASGPIELPEQNQFSPVGPGIPVPRVPQERAEQLRRYLAGSTGIGAVGLRVLSPGELPDATLDAILFSLRTFYTLGNFDSSSAVTRPKFWRDTDLAIYLMKVDTGTQRGASESQMRAFSLLKHSTRGATNVMSEGTATFLIELLSTLSPLNTRTCSYVRKGLLIYFTELAREQLVPGHPVRLVLEKLKTDNDSKDVTIQALSFIVDRLQINLGPLHDLSMLGTVRLSAVLRRNGDYSEAIKVVSERLRAIRSILGPGSYQERKLARQLEHIYMDQQDWVSALSVCFEIVGQREPEGIMVLDPRHHDEVAVYTMEDIAKICECSGNFEQAVAWTKQALVSGSLVWGETESLGHIRDKLRELLRSLNREDGIALPES